MQKIILIATSCIWLIHSSLASSVASLFLDEMESIDRAIATSERRLLAQHKIKKSMVELRHLEETIVKVEDAKISASQMVNMAEHILRMIQDEHLEALFSFPYMEELRFYASFAHKTSLSPKKLQ